MTSRLRSRVAVLALASASIAAIASPAVLAAPSAQVARRPRTTTCDVSSLAGTVGTGITVTSLKVTGARCGRGIAVVRAFHACRLKNGPSGRCVRLVRGYACQEQRTTVSTQINGTVTCRKDRATVAHRYTQTL